MTRFALGLIATLGLLTVGCTDDDPLGSEPMRGDSGLHMPNRDGGHDAQTPDDDGGDGNDAGGGDDAGGNDAGSEDGG